MNQGVTESQTHEPLPKQEDHYHLLVLLNMTTKSRSIISKSPSLAVSLAYAFAFSQTQFEERHARYHPPPNATLPNADHDAFSIPLDPST